MGFRRKAPTKTRMIEQPFLGWPISGFYLCLVHGSAKSCSKMTFQQQLMAPKLNGLVMPSCKASNNQSSTKTDTQ